MTNPLRHPEPAAVTLSWLERIIEDLDGGTEDLELALSAEVCAVICADSSSHLSSRARALVAQAREIATGAFDRLGDRAFELPGILLLLAAVVEQQACGEPIPPLGEYAKAAAATLCAPQATMELPGYLAPRLLLSRLGLASGGPITERSLPPGLARLLLSQPARLSEGLHRIEAASHCGLQPILAPRSLRRALGAILLCRLQDYDLDTSCRVLRSLIYLGEKERASLVTQSSQFLLDQQNEDGSFGFLESECASLLRRFPGTRVDLRFRLGTTICVLWTLSELHCDGYRLLRDLGRGLTGSRLQERPLTSAGEIS